MKIQPEVLEKLRRLDTPTICNVIELFEVRPRNTGDMDDRIKACFPEMPRSWALRQPPRFALQLRRVAAMPIPAWMNRHRSFLA